MTTTITTPELIEQLGNSGLAVVDVRPIAAYNGWKLLDEARGGHIAGAIAFPLSWTDNIEACYLKTLLMSKGITAEKSLVVYGYGRGDSATMEKTLVELGYPNVCTYQEGLKSWANDEKLPMSRLTHYEKLVHPSWVANMINGKHVESYPDKGIAIFHVNSGLSAEYAAGHIPGAMYLDTNVLESSYSWNRRSAKELEGALLEHGIAQDTSIVLYGRNSSHHDGDTHPVKSAGHIAAARAATILMYAGVKDVRLLDGGLDSWLSAGYNLEQKLHKPAPVHSFGSQIPNRPELIIDMRAAKALLRDPNGALVSMRSWAEYSSVSSGYDYIEARGRIPGALWGNPGSDAYHMEKYRNLDNTMRSYPEIESKWQNSGITREQRVAFFCGTGWRASETFFYAHIMGWDKVAVYDGGWLEWSSDESNPIEVSVP